MAVVPDFPIVAIMEETQIPTRTYKLDLENGRIIGFVDKEDAINQAAMKALYTPRFDCYAYDDQYGSEIRSLIGNPDATREYIEAEMNFILNDTLRADGRFTGVDDLEIEFEGDEARFTFTADTILGLLYMEGATEGV
jgi:hypothetical protein